MTGPSNTKLVPEQPFSPRRPWRRRVVRLAIFLALLYALLLLPEKTYLPPLAIARIPFAWSQDAFWNQLESEFAQARALPPQVLAARFDAGLAAITTLLDGLPSQELTPADPAFGALETNLFHLAPLAGALPSRTLDYAQLVNRMRREVKLQSARWDLNSPPARQRLYRLLQGSRVALEEILLQAPSSNRPPAVLEADAEPSPAPALKTHGLTVHSGDILLSRGGVPTSALIARGNDYPASFSHAALLHVEAQTGRATIIESLIECGLHATPFEDYLQEHRFRLMVLRLRADLPAMRADPLLPHKVATLALARTQGAHVPYDFAMDSADPSAQFCSEVVARAFAAQGVRLWQARTFISSPVTRAWLGSAGVRNFETQEPSELEYDPQVRVVAEWREPDSLLRAHIDDAVTDVMFSEGRPGVGLPYPALLLPLARLAKSYSVLLNLLGKPGPVPEGMTAATALRVQSFAKRHRLRAQRVQAQAEAFEAKYKYRPLYWQLINFAGQPKI